MTCRAAEAMLKSAGPRRFPQSDTRYKKIILQDRETGCRDLGRRNIIHRSSELTPDRNFISRDANNHSCSSRCYRAECVRWEDRNTGYGHNVLWARTTNGVTGRWLNTGLSSNGHPCDPLGLKCLPTSFANLCIRRTPYQFDAEVFQLAGPLSSQSHSLSSVCCRYENDAFFNIFNRLLHYATLHLLLTSQVAFAVKVDQDWDNPRIRGFLKESII